MSVPAFIRTKVAPVILAGTACCMITPFSAVAGEITVEAAGTQKVSWSSNPLLIQGEHKALFGSTTSPSLTIVNSTPMSQLKLYTQLNQNVFNQTAFNSTDINSTASFAKQSRHWDFEFAQSVVYDTTRTSEETGYGRTTKVSRHTALSSSPTLTYTPTALDEFSLGGNFTVSRYKLPDYTDYRLFSVTPTYVSRYSSRSSGYITATLQRYESMDSTSNRIDSAGPSLGWRQQLSERLTADVSAGAQASRQFASGTQVQDWTWQNVFSASLIYAGEQDKLNIAATRTQTPRGDGTETLLTSFSIKQEHAVTRRFSLSASARMQYSDYLTNAAGNIDTYYGGSAGASYAITDAIKLNTGYTFRAQTLVSRDKTARDHSVMLSLIFHPTRLDLRD